jgi:hypothetical protein
MYIRNIVEDYMEGVYNILENSEVCEGFLQRRREKKAAKKAAKEEKRFQEKINSEIVISKNELPKCEKEFNQAVTFMKSLIKKEVPGAVFYQNNIKHSTRDLGRGYIEHGFTINLFHMDDDNYDRYKKKSNYKELRDSENSWDYTNELLDDNDKRIKNPIIAKGYKPFDDDETMFGIKKGDKEYITIDLGDEATFNISIFMYVVVKEDE